VPERPAADRFRWLPGLRAFVVLVIIVSRSSPLVDAGFDDLGIEMYLVLSGFIGAHALLNGQTTRSFFQWQTLQTLPSYCLAVMVILGGPFSGFPKWSLLSFNVDVAMLHVPTKLWYPAGAVLLWVVCVEVKGNALLPWVLRRRWLLRALIALSFLSRTALVAYCAARPHAPGFLRALPIFSLCRLDGLLLGAEAALWVQDGSPLVPLWVKASLPLLLVRMALLASPVSADSFIYPAFVLPMGVLTMVALLVRLARQPVSVLFRPRLAWLGTLGPGIYLTDSFVADLIAGPDPDAPTWWFCGEALVAAFLLSALLGYVFTDPIPEESDQAGQRGLAPSAGATPNRKRVGAVVAGTLALVFACQALTVGFSRFTPYHAHRAYYEWVARAYYDGLAQAFAHGQTSLLEKPAPQLLAMPDPYDPEQNDAWRLHDAILFNGKYYLYWGPAPALLLMPIQLLPEALRRRVTDGELTFFFSVVLVLVSAAFLHDLRRRIAPDSPPWTLAAWIAVSGLAFPLTFCLARPLTYEAAIIGGEAFLLLGVYCAWKSLTNGQRPGLLFLAALSWAMAVGTRLSLGPAVAGLVLATGVWIIRAGKPQLSAGTLWRCAVLCVPVGSAAVLLLVYNQVRFGSFRDFGTGNMLQGLNIHRLPASIWSSWRNIVPHFFRYGFQALSIESHFPFLRPASVPDPMAEPLHIPHWQPEPITGLFPYAPVLLCGLLLVLPQYRRPPVPAVLTRWLWPGLLVAALLAAMPMLVFLGSTMRYLMDVASLLVILAACGAWQLLAAPRPSARATRVIGFLAVTTCVVGLLVGMTGYENNIRSWDEFRRKVVILSGLGDGNG
jgi:peptidoglycan/LPS O-acetylase OafA/YrhL